MDPPEDPYNPGELTLQEQARIIQEQLQRTVLYWKAKREVKDEVIKQKYRTEDIAQSIPQILASSGLQTSIKNAVCRAQAELQSPQQQHQHLQQNREGAPWPPMPNPGVETNQAVLSARKGWRSFLVDRLQRMARQSGVPFARLRTAETEAARWERRQQLDRAFARHEIVDDDELVLEETAARPEHGLYSTDELFWFISRIKNANHSSGFSGVWSWDSVTLELPVLSMSEIQSRFSDLSHEFRQTGMDDEGTEHFENARVKMGNSLLQSNFSPHLKLFARRGLPNCQRATAWKTMMNVFVGPAEVSHWEKLKGDVKDAEALVDDLVGFEVSRGRNDDKYFPFDEKLEEILMVFHRDPWVSRNCLGDLSTLSAGCAKSKSSEGIYPPSGVLPYEGIGLTLGPLCYLFKDPQELYFVWRAVFARFWSRLFSFSSRPEHLLSLCKQFESLVQAFHPDLVAHCVSKGARPLRLVISWIVTAFAGLLEVEQVLILWDRIFAFDTLLLLPILAAALFLWRGDSLMGCDSLEEMQQVLADGDKILVIPLLQHFIFTSPQANPPKPG